MVKPEPPYRSLKNKIPEDIPENSSYRSIRMFENRILALNPGGKSQIRAKKRFFAILRRTKAADYQAATHGVPDTNTDFICFWFYVDTVLVPMYLPLCEPRCFHKFLALHRSADTGTDPDPSCDACRS